MVRRPCGTRAGIPSPDSPAIACRSAAEKRAEQCDLVSGTARRSNLCVRGRPALGLQFRTQSRNPLSRARAPHRASRGGPAHVPALGSGRPECVRSSARLSASVAPFPGSTRDACQEFLADVARRVGWIPRTARREQWTNVLQKPGIGSLRLEVCLEFRT